MKDWFSQNWFKVGILVAMILIFFAIYQSFVVIPREEMQREAEETRKKELADAAETFRLEKIENEKEEERQRNIDSCLLTVETNYSDNWSQSCKTLGKLSNYCINILKKDGEGYNYYLKTEGISTTTVSLENIAQYLQAREDCSCSLPSTMATRWDDKLKEDQDACYARYR